MIVEISCYSEFRCELSRAYDIHRTKSYIWYFTGLGLSQNNWLHLRFTLYSNLMCNWFNKLPIRIAWMVGRIISLVCTHFIAVTRIWLLLTYIISSLNHSYRLIVLVCGVNLHFSITIIFLCRAWLVHLLVTQWICRWTMQRCEQIEIANKREFPQKTSDAKVKNSTVSTYTVE